MKFFCKHAVCVECKVLFEPPSKSSVDARWPNLCAAHRKLPRERYERRRAVENWAAANYERLEKQMLAEQEEDLAKARANMQAFAQSACQAPQQSAMAHGYYGPLGLMHRV